MLFRSNRQLYLPEYCLSAHDPSFGRTMDLPLVMAALMNCWGEDVLPEEVAYVMEAAFSVSVSPSCQPGRMVSSFSSSP